MAEEKKPEKDQQLISLKEFYESTPPGKRVQVVDIFNGRYLKKIDIQLFCTAEECSGIRYFQQLDNPFIGDVSFSRTFVQFQCRNCRKRLKIYAVNIVRGPNESVEMFKYGENPPFGPPIPPKVISLIGPDKDLFLKGRRCENQGLGVGAFTYYRRVVENQKDRIFEEILRVSKQMSAPKEIIDGLEAAIKETQFTKAIETIKPGIPEGLLINGHNPLTLLHKALSSGLHNQSDEKCLELAHDIRVVLFEMVDRLDRAMRDNAELNTAVSRLMNPSQ